MGGKNVISDILASLHQNLREGINGGVLGCTRVKKSPEFRFAVDEVGTAPSYYVQHMDDAIFLPVGVENTIP